MTKGCTPTWRETNIVLAVPCMEHFILLIHGDVLGVRSSVLLISIIFKVADIHKKTCWYQLRHFLGLHAALSTEERCRLVEELQSLYESCHSLVKEVPTTEPRPSDVLLVLSAHILWELWSTSREDK